jgi:hypothetical protein
MRVKIIFLFLFLVSSKLLAQLDDSGVVKTDFFAYQPEKQSETQNLNLNTPAFLEKKIETITRFGSLDQVASNFPKYSVKEKEVTRGMLQKAKVDDDVLVQKYWNGQDMNNVKITTELELGKIETDTKTVRIECRDHSYVDGDRVRVSVNNEIIRSNVVLKAGYYMIDIDLSDGFNRIDIKALNQGTSGPNTAEFQVFDGKGNLLASKEWNILTGYVATLIVMKN